MQGAEVVRMYETLLGKDGFRRGMDLYFERHDGQAVTCDDFLAAMRDANQADLGRFPLWYQQAGTPKLSITTHYDDTAKTFTLRTK
jgi:aminopeptidase N